MTVRLAPEPSFKDFLQAVRDAEIMKDLEQGLFSNYGGHNAHLNWIKHYKAIHMVETKKKGVKTFVYLTDKGREELEGDSL